MTNQTSSTQSRSTEKRNRTFWEKKTFSTPAVKKRKGALSINNIEITNEDEFDGLDSDLDAFDNVDNDLNEFEFISNNPTEEKCNKPIQSKNTYEKCPYEKYKEPIMTQNIYEKYPSKKQINEDQVTHSIMGGLSDSHKLNSEHFPNEESYVGDLYAGDFVIVELLYNMNTKKSHLKYFIAHIIKLLNDDLLEVSFLKKKDRHFNFPHIRDIANVPQKDVVQKLYSKTERRGNITFLDTFKVPLSN